MPEPDDDMIVDNEPDVPAPGQDENPQPNQPDSEPEGALLDNDEEPEQPETPSPEEGDQPEEADPGDQPEPEQPTEPEPAPEEKPQPVQEEKVTDPGAEFTPKNDYSFDIELADGTKVHVTKPEDIENLPADADFGTPANLMKAQAKLNVMTTGLDQERREWEASKEKFEAQETAAKETEERVAAMVAEMNYLETKGKLPKIDPQYENADWSDPEVAKQPGVKERLDLLNYRLQENETRVKLNLPPMSLLEAQLQMQDDQAVAKATEVKDKQATQRKAKGAMVGGSAPTPATNLPDDMIVGEGGSIRDLNPAY